MCVPGAHGSQDPLTGFPQTGSLATMQMLGTESESFAISTSALNCSAISLAPPLTVLKDEGFFKLQN